jgi:nitroreductase
VGVFEADTLLEKFPEMAGLVPIALLPIGYPAENARPSRLHESRKPMEELVKYL